MGLPHAIHIYTTNVINMNDALEAVAIPAATLTAVSQIIVDSAYSSGLWHHYNSRFLGQFSPFSDMPSRFIISYVG